MGLDEFAVTIRKRIEINEFWPKNAEMSVVG